VPMQNLDTEAVDLATLEVASSELEPVLPERSMGEVLRLIGSELAGSILMTLGQRPLRAKQLTGRVPDYSARSVYRCVTKLEAFGLVEHRPGPDASSHVLLWLTKPVGRNLFHQLCELKSESTAGLSLEECGLPWDSLRQLGELWEFAAELGLGSRSLASLLDGAVGMTYHQVQRRAGQFVENGLLSSTLHDNRSKHYELTACSRRRMVVIASLGRWRHRYLLANGTPGLGIEEMATVLRTTLPLVTLAGYGGMSVDFVVTGAEDETGVRATADLRFEVADNGTLRLGEVGEVAATGSATATLNTWFAALLDDNRGRIRARGNLPLVDACLTQLYDELWVPLER
jgi:DNA-binding HxlR family transcriptional regulator